MKYFLLPVLLVILAPPASAGESDWRTFTSEAGGFTVLLPGTPIFSDTTDHTVVGAVGENLYSLETAAASFSAEYSDLPGVATFFESADSLYNDAREGLLKQTGARQTGYYGIEQESIRGKEITYEVPANRNSPLLHGKARFLLRDKRLYVLVVTTPEMSDADGIVSRYLDSFRLLK
ncbi:MAG: hypothetical protein V1789_03295 [PVC group bacterium]